MTLKYLKTNEKASYDKGYDDDDDDDERKSTI